MYLLRALLDMRESMGEISIQFYIMDTKQKGTLINDFPY